MRPGNRRRLEQLREAALNLGMRDEDARHYAEKAMIREMQSGDWNIVPQSTEALMD